MVKLCMSVQSCFGSEVTKASETVSGHGRGWGTMQQLLWPSYMSSLAAMEHLQDEHVHHYSARVRCE